MAKVGSRLIQCDGTFLILGDGGTVVIQSSKGQLPEIVEGGSHVCLGEDAGLLQVAVGEVPGRVFNQDDAMFDLGGKGGMPESGRVSGSKEDAPHAQLGGVH